MKKESFVKSLTALLGLNVASRRNGVKTSERNVRRRKIRFETLESRELLAADALFGAVESLKAARLVSDFACYVDESQPVDVAISLSQSAPNSVVNTSAAKDAKGVKRVWTVTSIKDSATTPGTLRYAIDNANVGDAIKIAKSLTGKTITLSGGQLEIDKSLTIDASQAPGITISANGKSRVAYIEEGEVVFKGLRLENGNARQGGGVYVSSGSFTLEDATITGCAGSNPVPKKVWDDSLPNELASAAFSGGGIYVRDGSLTLTRSTISNNAAFSGGGIYVSNGSLTLTDSVVSDNRATCGSGGGIFVFDGLFRSNNVVITDNAASYNGGGVYVENGYLVSTNCNISDNTADQAGGGIYVGSMGSFTSTNDMISDNTAFYGGGVCVENGYFASTNCNISDNAAVGDGGGVYVCYNGSFTSTNDMISDNTAFYGGGVYIESGYFTSTNCNISDNTADQAGGGVYVENGSFTLMDGTISGNTAFGASGGLVLGCEGDVYYPYGGGGVYVHNHGSFTLTNGKISDNAAVGDGGGVHIYEGSFTSTNGTIAGNSSNCSGGGIYDWLGSSVFYNSIVALNEASRNDVDDISGAYWTVQGYNNVSSYDFGDPSNVLYDDSMPLFVDPDYSDYRLAPGSCAISVGSNEFAQNARLDLGSSLDLAGAPRLVGESIDAGAYEYQVDLSFYRPNGWSDSVILLADSKAPISTTYSSEQTLYLAFAYKSACALTETFEQQVYVDGRLVKSYEVDGSSNDVENGLIVGYQVGKLKYGVHTITVKLDGTNAISEADENNNLRSITITVFPKFAIDPKSQTVCNPRVTANDFGTTNEWTICAVESASGAVDRSTILSLKNDFNVKKASLYDDAFEDSSFSPFEEDDEFDFVKAFCSDFDEPLLAFER